MYDSGSQWAELTLCLPSPMPFLLDLHDMKLVNFRTAVRYTLRRIDNSDNLQDGKFVWIQQYNLVVLIFALLLPHAIFY